MRKFFSLFLTVLFVTQLLQAQDFSNRGKDFWIAYPSHIDGTASVMGLYITSDQNAVGTIEAGGTTISFTVTANTVTRKFLGPNAAGDAPNTGVHLSSQDGIEVGKGIRVKSDKPVVVYAHIIRSARSGATLVLPVSVLSKEYIIPSYRNVGSQGTNGGYGELAVVATDTNTVVEITPVVNSRNGARAAGVAYTVTLANPGDVYQVQFQQNADISGTAVRSVAVNGIKCKKIAVFSATTWTAFDCTTPVASGGDNLFQQPFPTTSWGKNFLTAPFFSNPLNIDIVRVFVKDPSTIVQKTEAGVTTTLTGLINGSYYEYATGNPTAISADKHAS
ncbi:MAG: IgGFc-binding protein, partial [Lacibacter sp.]